MTPASNENAYLSPTGISQNTGASRTHRGNLEYVDAPHTQALIDASKDIGFSVVTKLVVFLSISISVSLTTQPLYSSLLTAALLLYLVANKQKALSFKLLVSYIVLFLIYVSMTYFGIRILVFSPMHIFLAWKAYPALVASIALVTSPPGMISAFLARFHIPKKIIVGTLVIFRFFPTMKTGMQRLSESLKNRGLTGFKQIISNPLDSLEYLLVPTMMTLVNSADQLSSSAIVRAAEAPTKRTSYYGTGQNWQDYLCQIVFVLAALLFIAFTGGF
ncbi:MAG: energy-coupling factor transporter transmembrane component T family protein [Raoultibacter sp.]|jgi:energy-coupling factor transporter transmembrane protein EcfT